MARVRPQANFGVLFTAKHLKSMLFLIGMYGIWNLWAGTNGFFFPYILRTVGSQSQVASVAMQAAGFFVAMLSIGLIFMRFSDRVNQRVLIATSTVIQMIGMASVGAVSADYAGRAGDTCCWCGSARDSGRSRSFNSGARSCFRH